MKKTFAASLVFVSMLLACSLFAEETTIKVSIGEWEPYTGEKIAGNGMATEIVTAACTAAGLKAEYVFVPWKRAENNVLIGRSFATFPYKELPERLAHFWFSETLFSSSYGVVMYKKNAKTANFKHIQPGDFANYSVGIVAGTDAIKLPLEKAGVKVEEAQVADQNLKKLEAGRIDFYIDDKAVIFQSLKKTYSAEKMANFIFLDQDFGLKNDFKVMISQKYPNSKELEGQFNEGLRKINASGEYEKILGKYGL